MQYRNKFWLLKIISIIRNYYEKLLNCYQIAVRDKMLAAHILLHALLSLSLPGRSHREENVFGMRTVLIVKMNLFAQKLSLSLSGASRSQYNGCHPSLG